MRENRKTFIILFTVTVLYTVYRYQGGVSFFLTYFHPQLANRSARTIAVYYRWCMSFLLLGVVPACIVKFGFKERLSRYGVTAKQPLVTVFITLLGVVIATPLAYFGAKNPVISYVYPLAKYSGVSPGRFIESSFFYLLYYIGYEFCFRGFLFMGIKDDLGELQAIGVSLIASVLCHVTQPQSEMALAIVAGIAFPLVASRLGSLLPGTIIHAYMGIALDYWIIMRGGGF